MTLPFNLLAKNRGENFRTAFQRLGGLRALTNSPFMALTASAPPRVEEEVKTILDMNMNECILVSLPLDRPNTGKRKVSLSVSFLF